MATSKNRQLAAILFADIVGYTALMQKDEKNAALLLRHFHLHLEEKVAAHEGRIVNFYGDGALCTFKIPIDAVRCAMALQTTFQENPQTPVRIGIHSGTVTLEGEKIFGNSVNITSRIESMGIPGGILLSKKVRDEVKNNPDLQMQSLGSFEFKNVEEPMKVYALANEGFPVPKRSEITGKLKSKQTNYSHFIYAILGLIIISLAFFWYNSHQNQNSIALELTENFSIKTPLSKSVREKRVAVMVFENKTREEDLEDFGLMISDWITQGLLETREANVISAANIKNQISEADAGNSVANPTFVAATGVGVLIKGRYYLQNNQLLILANIVNTATGEVIHALEVTVAKEELLSGLEELSQNLLGFWAVKQTKRFVQKPPKYEAYQQYTKGFLSFASDFENAERLLKSAYETDSTFYAPLFRLIPLYRNNNKLHLADSLINLIQQKNPPLTQWETLRFGVLKALLNWEWEDYTRLNEELYEMDPSDRDANSNAVLGNLLINRPQKAIDLWDDFDKRYLDKEVDLGWTEGYVAGAYNRLGNDYKTLEVVDFYRSYRTKIFHIVATNHLIALVRLNRPEALAKQLDYYLQVGIYDFSLPQDPAYLFQVICNELYILDKTALLEKYVQQFNSWNETNKAKTNYHRNAALCFFYSKKYTQASTTLETYLSEVKVPKNPLDVLALLGICYAKMGDNQKAINVINKIDNLPFPKPYSSMKPVFKADIELAMGNKTLALETIQKAMEDKVPYMSDFYKANGFLKPLFGDATFEALVKPK